MKFNILKRAFSLTELLIVLVVVAVLFAAMAPFMTKRGKGSTPADEPVWMFVKDDPEKSAFYDPGSAALTSTAYVGFNPKYLGSNNKPYSKLVLRANNNWQNLIQFRIGNDGNGTLAGIFALTPEGSGMNMVMGSRMHGDPSNNYNSLVRSGTFNTVIGSNAAAKMESAGTSTVVGATSSMGGYSDSSLVGTLAIGANSNQYSMAKNSSTLIGSNVGRAENNAITNSVAVGANSLGLPTSSGTANVLLGYNVGSVGMKENSLGNVILNSPYFGEAPKLNTIIGPRSYDGGASNAENLTAIGYNSCASFSSAAKGTTTCIGYQSAHNYGTQDTTKNFDWGTDAYDHMFIGGKPNGSFPGRSILEIHNIPYENNNKAYPKNIGPTVVLNSNLVVRGNMYIPNSISGEVGAFTYVPIQSVKSDTEKGKDECKRCFLRRRGWRSKDCSSWWKILLGIVLMAGAIVGAIFTGGATLAIIPEILVGLGIGASWVGGGALLGSGISGLFGGSGWYRMKDQATIIGLGVAYENSYKYKSGIKFECSKNSAPYFTKNYCPNVLRTSDLRLKENITPSTVALSKILQVTPYHYTYKTDKAAVPQVGVIAQDLEKYLPSAVSADLNGYKQIRWDEMFYATINSVKSLDDSVNKLNSEIIVMESDVEAIAKDQKAIKARIKDVDKKIKKLENN